jgi:ribonuclease P protein component
MVHAGEPGQDSSTFPRSLRLTLPGEYRFVFEQARAVRDDAFRILCRDNALAHCRLGLAVSRKVSRSAVGRNRLKRLVRESFRHHQEALAESGPVDIVVLPTPLAATICNAELARRLAALWHKMRTRQAAGAGN